MIEDCGAVTRSKKNRGFEAIAILMSVKLISATKRSFIDNVTGTDEPMDRRTNISQFKLVEVVKLFF